ncbi:MAG: stage V sporulation protein AB [Lachnospiraceae bacterium]|nr:stage V sporulation protein AB [Lachnospiraceae bacterium]
MFLKWCLLFGGGLIFGCSTAAGVIALLTTLGVVPRMIARFQVANAIIPCECAITVGGIVGCITTLGSGNVGRLTGGPPSIWQNAFLMIVALCCGIYVGCQAMALAEILNTFPILFRRTKLQMGLRVCILFIALGKLVGSLWYFAFGYQSI